MASKSSSEEESPSRSREKMKFSNWFSFGSSTTATASSPSAITKPSPKNDRNVFARMKKKFEKRFPGSSSKKYEFCGVDITGLDTDSADSTDDGANREDRGANAFIIDPDAPMEADERRKYLRKKWMGSENPNMVMYQACMEMLSYAWYWGEISRHEAQRQLTDKPNGSFLIRDSEKDGSQFTLSFRMWNRTLHYRIQYHDNYWHFEARKYESMVEMVENFMNRSDNEMFFVQRTSDIMPPFPVVLRYPISRYLKFITLQDLCRRVVQRNFDESQIRELPIPQPLKTYLTEKDSVVVGGGGGR